jgi:molybdopterin molybdotransferase
MISVDDALALLDKHRPNWGERRVKLSEANGFVLAQDIIAPTDFPAHAVSIMDGYALKKADHGNKLTLIGESRAGVPFAGSLGENETVRIFTGALIPQGADLVEIQENAFIAKNQTVSFVTSPSNRTYIRPAGADIKQGDRLFRAGTRITAAMILALATCNIAEVSVRARPKIALLASGDELKPIGSELGKGEIINAITPALIARLSSWGFDVVDLGIAPDTPALIREKFETCDADIIVPIGAASVGKYDLMQPTAYDLGYASVFSKVAVKPGKPVWFSKSGKKCLLGLPGNPSSAWVTAHIFLYYLLNGELPWRKMRLAQRVSDNGPRETYLRAKILPDGRVSTLRRQDSGLVTPLSQAGCLICRPANDGPRDENYPVKVLML